MTTVNEFLEGKSIEYDGFRRVKRKYVRLRATFMLGVGVIIDNLDGSRVGVVPTDEVGARRTFHNLLLNTRRP